MSPGLRRPALDKMQRECIAFNEAFRIGAPISVYPGAVGGPLAEVSIVAPGAHVLGGHTAVVQVGGRHGCIALTHVCGWSAR
jgi:hypothetical protein